MRWVSIETAHLNESVFAWLGVGWGWGWEWRVGSWGVGVGIWDLGVGSWVGQVWANVAIGGSLGCCETCDSDGVGGVGDRRPGLGERRPGLGRTRTGLWTAPRPVTCAARGTRVSRRAAHRPRAPPTVSTLVRVRLFQRRARAIRERGSGGRGAGLWTAPRPVTCAARGTWIARRAAHRPRAPPTVITLARALRFRRFRPLPEAEQSRAAESAIIAIHDSRAAERIIAIHESGAEQPNNEPQR